MNWIHEISLSALAAAVLAMGLVIMLELRSIAQLRRSVDGHLQRVFEQLDLLRFETQLQGEASLPVLPARPATAPRGSTPTLAGAPLPPRAPASVPASAPVSVASRRAAGTDEDVNGRSSSTTGEIRLLASLAAARARIGHPAQAAGPGSPTL